VEPLPARNVAFEVGSLDPWSYNHLLGLYLGDGYITATRRGVHLLRIICDDRYPRVIAEATL
jgi:hypothetical protein